MRYHRRPKQRNKSVYSPELQTWILVSRDPAKDVFSYVPGDIVELIGRQGAFLTSQFAGLHDNFKTVGLVLRECDFRGQNISLETEKNERTFVEVMWPNNEREIIHKSFIRRIPKCERGVVRPRK